MTGSRNASFLDSSGNNPGGTVLLDLNCNDTSAFNGHPGNSVATPEGRQLKASRDTGVKINNDFTEATAAGQTSWCEENADDCKRICEESGTCSAELLDYLG